MYMEGIKYVNLIEIGPVVIEIQGVENGELAVPVNNTLVCHTAFLAADTTVCLDAGEKRILQFLQQFIGNISNENVGHFLRFITGSSICPTNKIQITFNCASGFARRPTAHTCAFTVELSTDYAN